MRVKRATNYQIAYDGLLIREGKDSMRRLMWLLVPVVLIGLVIYLKANAEPAPEKVSAMLINPLVSTNYGPAPELNNTTWINSDKPLKLSELRGKVVLLEFWTFECINCQHTLPAMKDFYTKYHDNGLVIIGDHFPEFASERDVDNVRAAVKENGIQYAVAIDNDGATWNAYQQRYWPVIYLIDKQGQIRYKVIGEHDYSITEEAIQALLAE
jgi:thiol-disulfide isomerase/thioredoxin